MRHILVADDEPHMTHVLKLYLERAGYVVQTCANGQQALAAVRDRAPDALITDIQMPQMNGQELWEAIERELPQRSLPIFVITSMTEREAREWTAAIRALHFLEKPLSMRALVATLDRHFGSAPAAVEVRHE